jgi:hypothetical protein
VESSINVHCAGHDNPIIVPGVLLLTFRLLPFCAASIWF